MRNHEITEKHKLLDKTGNISESGYAVSNILEYDRSDIKTAKVTIKEWDYYLVSNDNYAVAMTVADNGYMGLLSVSLLDFNKPFDITTTRLVGFPMGKFRLPPTSRIGDVLVDRKDVKIKYKHIDGGRQLSVFMKNFHNKSDFTANFTLSNEPQQSMTIATPFHKPKRFYYNQKINCFKAEGTVRYSGGEIVFDKADSVGMLDWGRGVWTYKNTWYWATASGYIDGVPFGLNLGYGFGDTRAASENMIFYDGMSHKTDDVDFGIPKSKKGKYDFMKTWHFTSSDNRIDFLFEPIIDRKAFISALIIKSDQHQVFGKMNGFAVLDDGTKLEFCNLLGSAEVITNCY